MGEVVVVVSDEGLGGVIPFGAGARAMGFEPVLLTGQVAAPALEQWRTTFADLRVLSDPYDPEVLVESAASLARGRRIAALFSCYDGLVLPAARAAARLGVPHPDPGGLERSRDKYVTRTTIAAHGLPTPRFARVRTEEECLAAGAETGYPAIVKPLNGMASHLVQRAENAAELLAAYRRLAANIRRAFRGNYTHPVGGAAAADPATVFLVEEFLSGIEYSAEVLVRAGRVERVALFEKLFPDLERFWERGFSCSPFDPERAEAIWQHVEAVLGALGVDDAACHVEVIDTERGPMLIENNAGRAGGQILVRAVRERFGIDLIAEILALQTGRPRPPRTPPSLDGRVSTLTIFPERSGRIAALDGLDLVRALPGVVDVVPFCRPGDVVDVEDKEFFAVNILVAGLERDGLSALYDAACAAVRFRFEAPGALPERAFLDDSGRRDAIVARSRLVRFLRDFLDARGFLEVQTPFLHAAPEVGYVRQSETTSADGSTLYLRTDPEEYLKRYLTIGFDAVFELCANVRSERPDALHLQEFTSLECYRRSWALDEAIATCCDLVRESLRQHHGSATGRLNGADVHFEPPVDVLTFRELIVSHAGIDYADHPTADELAGAIRRRGWWNGTNGPLDGYRRTWLEWLLEQRVLPQLARPTFVVDFPVELGLSARPRPDDPAHCLRAELYLPGGVELAHLYENLTDAEALRRRCEARLKHRVAAGLPAVSLDEGLLGSAALGMPPMGGFAIGVDRLLLLILGDGVVGDGLLFPREGFASP
jgi:elongation factor P--beta-lysine ligase/biotin carboxylase